VDRDLAISQIRTSIASNRSKPALFFALTLFLGVTSVANAQSVPSRFVVEGRLYDSSDSPLNPANPVTIKLEVIGLTSTNAACVLYREVHTSVNISSTSNPSVRGVFALALGSGTAQYSASSLPTLFGTATVSGEGSCMTAGIERLVRTSVDTGSGYETLSPDTRLESVPTAITAGTAGDASALGGVSPSGYVKVKDDGATSLNQANLESVFSATNYTKLEALLDGSSSQYLTSSPTAPLAFNGQRLTNVAAPSANTDAATKGYADSSIGGRSMDLSAIGPALGDGKTLIWDATSNRWVAGTPLGTDSSKLQGYDVAATAPTSGQVLKWNGAAWAPASDLGITALVGDVMGAGTGSIAVTIANDSITSAKIKSTGNFVNRLLITDGTDGSQITYATCGTDEVLKWTTIGWTCAGVGSLAPVTSVAGKVGSVSLNINDVDGWGTAALRHVGTNAGNLIELDASTKLPAVDGSQLTGVNAQKLQSKSISASNPNSNDVLKYNSASSIWEPKPISNLLGGSPFLQGGNSFGNDAEVGTNDANSLHLKSNGTFRLSVNVNGNVGVNNTSPASLLHVGSTSGSNNVVAQFEGIGVFKQNLSGSPSALILKNFNGSDTGTSLEFRGNSSSVEKLAARIRTSQTSGDGKLYFDVAQNDSFQERMIVTDLGYVGIGTSDPAAQLDVNGTIRAQNICDQTGSNCKTISSGWSTGGASQWTTTGSDIYYNSGNVGIGTSAPGVRLEVNGDVKVAHLSSNKAISGYVIGPASGTSPTVVYSGTDLGSKISVTVGTSPNSPPASIIQVQFSATLSSIPVCTFSPASATAVGLSVYSTTSASSYTLFLTGATPLTQGTVYSWNVTCLR
jgi:hypothetical protein